VSKKTIKDEAEIFDNHSGTGMRLDGLLGPPLATAPQELPVQDQRGFSVRECMARLYAINGYLLAFWQIAGSRHRRVAGVRPQRPATLL
jgi:hypothetical protein